MDTQAFRNKEPAPGKRKKKKKANLRERGRFVFVPFAAAGFGTCADALLRDISNMDSSSHWYDSVNALEHAVVQQEKERCRKS